MSHLASSTDNSASPPRTIRPLLLIIFILILVLLTSYFARLRQIGLLEQEISNARQNLQQANVQSIQLAEHVKIAGEDTEIADIARQTLNMGLSTEQIYIVVTPVANPQSLANTTEVITSPAPVPQPKKLTPPIWQQWYELFVSRATPEI